MADQMTPASKGAWSAVIIALSAAPNVDFGTLRDLIRSIPNVSYNLSNQAVEVIALRCLEGVYDLVKVSKCSASSSFYPKEIRFDSSESPVHVLQLVMEQATSTKLKKDGSNALDNLRMSASDELLRELDAFIKYGKDNMLQCALQEVGNSLQQVGVSIAVELENTNGIEAQNSPDKTNKLWKEKSASSLQYEMDVQGCRMDVKSDELHPGKELRRDGEGEIAYTELYSVPPDDVELSPPNYAQLYVCIKCEQGDELLTCSACQMLVHERCLEVPTGFDSNGNFICPICEFSREFTRYAEIKENLLFATEDLFLYLSARPRHQQLDQSMVSAEVNARSPSEGMDLDGSVSVTTAPTSIDEESGPAIPCEYVPSKDTHSVDWDSKDQQDDGHSGHLKGKQKLQTEHLDDADLHKGNPKKHQLHALSKNAVCPSPVDITGTMAVKTCKTKPSGNFSAPQKQPRLSDQVTDALSSSNGDHSGTSEEETSKAVTSKHSLRHLPKQKLAPQKDAYNASHSDPDGNLEGEDCCATSDLPLENERNGISHYDVNAEVPQLRRQRVPFSAEEVAMLKEGVKRFGFQWNAILDFGCKVFYKGREPVDLKDKWRNMVLYKQV